MVTIGPSLVATRHVALSLREKCGADAVAKLSAEVGIPNPLVAPESQTITVHQEAKFVQRACEVAGDIDFALRNGLTYGIAGGLPGYLLRHAQTVRDAIVLACKYSEATRPGISLVMEEIGSSALICVTLADARLHEMTRHREWLFAGVTSQIRTFTNRPFYPSHVQFTHLRDPIAREVQARIGCPVKFGMHSIEMRVPRTSLDIPIVGRDDVLRDILINQGDTQLALAGRHDIGIAERVELLLQASFPQTLPSADEVAKKLGVSSRTLARRLNKTETSFSSILNHVRLRIAARELRDSEVRISEIAYRLGYTGQAAFSTAFRRETGMSPREYRALIHDGGGGAESSQGATSYS